MSLVLLGEYRSQNSQRCYPFADDVTLMDAEGNALPTDFIIDAFLFPLGITGGVYLHSVDVAAGKLYFATSDNSSPFGVATYDQTDTAYVYETEGYTRQIGVVVFGAGIDAIMAGSITRVFSYAATALAPAAFAPLNQTGVRGILLDDGTLLTGDVTLRGGSGVTVLTLKEEIYTDDDGLIVIGFQGMPKPSSDDCGNPNPLIKKITFRRNSCSPFSLGAYGTGISLNGYGFTLDDLCQADRSTKLPDAEGNLPSTPSDDVCSPPVPPEPCDCGGEQEVVVNAAGLLGGTLTIATPSVGSYLNPIKVFGVRGGSRTPHFVQAKPVSSANAVEGDAKAFRNPPSTADGLVVWIHSNVGGPGGVSASVKFAGYMSQHGNS